MRVWLKLATSLHQTPGSAHFMQQSFGLGSCQMGSVTISVFQLCKLLLFTNKRERLHAGQGMQRKIFDLNATDRPSPRVSNSSL